MHYQKHTQKKSVSVTEICPHTVARAGCGVGGHLAHSSSSPIDNGGLLATRKSDRSVNQTTHLHKVRRLRMPENSASHPSSWCVTYTPSMQAFFVARHGTADAACSVKQREPMGHFMHCRPFILPSRSERHAVVSYRTRRQKVA
jgi:hypothetical protein